MLSSVLPGFRDIRTPIVVGALWAAVIWFALQSYLPTEADAAQHFVRDSAILGWRDHFLLFTVGVFASYVLGVATVIDPLRGVAGLLVDACDRRRSSAKAFVARSRLYVAEADELLTASSASSDDRDKFDAHSESARYNDYDTLKTRLLRDAEDLYLSCDKSDAEASLRLSAGLPLLAACILGWQELNEPLFLSGIPFALILLYRGATRALEGRDLARQAVTAGLVTHPLQDLIEEFPLKAKQPAADEVDVNEVGVS